MVISEYQDKLALSQSSSAEPRIKSHELKEHFVLCET